MSWNCVVCGQLIPENCVHIHNLTPDKNSLINSDPVEPCKCLEKPAELHPSHPTPAPLPKADSSSPEGASSGAVEQGIKHDEGKNILALLPPEFIEGVGRILTFGAGKYNPNNWRGGFKYTRVMSALLRHLMAYLRGERNDKETNLSHLWHAGCNLAFLITFDAHPEVYKEFNDLYFYKKEEE